MSEGEDALSFWRAAQTTLNAARQTVDIDPSTAANRAYYAAFYAVSALLATEGKTFKRHTAVEVAVHRDLVHAGRWPKDLGTAFSELQRLRTVADYEVSLVVSKEQADSAVKQAEAIVETVRDTCSELD